MPYIVTHILCIRENGCLDIMKKYMTAKKKQRQNKAKYEL